MCACFLWFQVEKHRDEGASDVCGADCGGSAAGAGAAAAAAAAALDSALASPATGGGEAEGDLGQAGGQRALRMCPCCGAGPLMNEHCSDLK